MSGTPTVLDIFKSLSFQQERGDCPTSGLSSEVARFVSKSKELPQGAMSLQEAINKFDGSFTLKQRLNTLHKIREELKSSSGFLPEWKTGVSLFIDYIGFYCDLLLQAKITERECISVLIVLSCDSFLPAAATISAALAAGSCVIVSAHETKLPFLVFLQEVFSKAGMPSGLFNFVTHFQLTEGFPLKDIEKSFFFGHYSFVRELCSRHIFWQFNFLCPNNTAAFILESADFDAAVDKIIWETWGKEDPFFAVSTLVVQESVSQEIFQKLRYKLDKLMIENTYSLKFQDKYVAEKIKKLVTEALNAGATVEESRGCGEWHPTVIFNYQSQSVDDDVPVMKVLICRTAKEGVALLNNCRYSLGTSIWSEISSEALEISSNLICPNIWINSHGQTDPSVPLQGTGFSGNCVLGGTDGFMEFYKSGYFPDEVGYQMEKYQVFNNRQFLELADAAQKGFLAWRLNKNKGEYLYKIFSSLEININDINRGESSYAFYLSECNCSEQFSFVKEKIPVGVILLLINPINVSKNTLLTLTVSAISEGNSLIIAFTGENPELKVLIKSCIEILPKNVVSFITETHIESVLSFILHPNIQAVWCLDSANPNLDTPTAFEETVLDHCAMNIKRFWAPDYSSVLREVCKKECSLNKTVWLPKIDQFPLLSFRS